MKRERGAPADRALDAVCFLDDGRVAPGRSVPIIDSLRDENWFVGEELRLLATKVHDLRRKSDVACVAVTSPLPGEGKSTVAVGLAAALARTQGSRVLLLEADVRRPSLNRMLDLPPCAGLAEYLNGSGRNVAIRVVEPGGFSLLVAGIGELERPESLRSPQMNALVRTARDLYDFVLLDAPPLIPVADAVLIQDMVDGFLLVVRSRQTPKSAIDDAVGKVRANAVLGLVLNDHREYHGSYRTYAYERYGDRGSMPRASGSRHGSASDSRHPSRPPK